MTVPGTSCPDSLDHVAWLFAFMRCLQLQISSLLMTLQALGCLLFFVAYGKLAFVGEAKLQVLNGDYTVPPRPQRPEPLRQLLRRMLTVAPGDRPNIDTVLQQLGQLATNLHADKGPSAASPPAASRPSIPAAPARQQQQHTQQRPPQQHVQEQPVSGNPSDLVAAPLPSSGHVLPSRRASDRSLKEPAPNNGPGRSSSPAIGGSPAPLSPTHLHQSSTLPLLQQRRPTPKPG